MFKWAAAGKTGKFKRIDNKLPYCHSISRLVFNFAIFKEKYGWSVIKFCDFSILYYVKLRRLGFIRQLRVFCSCSAEYLISIPLG